MSTTPLRLGKYFFRVNNESSWTNTVDTLPVPSSLTMNIYPQGTALFEINSFSLIKIYLNSQYFYFTS